MPRRTPTKSRKTTHTPSEDAIAVADQMAREADRGVGYALETFRPDQYDVQRNERPGKVFYSVSRRDTNQLIAKFFVYRPATILAGGPDTVRDDGVTVRPISGPFQVWGTIYCADGYNEECEAMYQAVTMGILKAGSRHDVAMQIDVDQKVFVNLTEGVLVELGEAASKSSKPKRGPNIDTNEKLTRLIDQKRKSIRNRKVTISFSNACDLAGVSPETVKANALELQKRWTDPDYLPEFTGYT